MSFCNSPLADNVAKRAASLIEAEPGLSRNAIIDRLLAEDGLNADEHFSRQYFMIVNAGMFRKRAA